MERQDAPQKRCTGSCGQEYDATTEFFHRKKDGLCPRCKECVSKSKKADYQRSEVKEHKRAYGKAYRAIPEVREKKRIYAESYRNSAEGQRRRRNYRNRTDKKEHGKALRKVYQSRTEVQERIQDWKKEYQSRPGVKEHIHAYHKARRSRPEVRERHRISQGNRQSRKKSISGTYTPAQIQDQLKRQRHKCYYCQKRLKKTKGRHIYHVEHTFPLSRVVGTDIPANSIDYLVLACPTCNLSKGDKFPWEWASGGRLL